jgi:hypothetical protein
MENTKIDGFHLNELSGPAQPVGASSSKPGDALQARFLRALNSGTSASITENPTPRTEAFRAPLRDAGEQPQRLPSEYLYAALAGGAWQPHVMSTPAVAMAPTSREADVELAALLERVCSAMYVGDKSASSQRVVLALDHVLPGAAAEIVREGVHLSIRLHTRTEHSYRLMSSQREALLRALGDGRDRRIDVVVVQDSIERALVGGVGG